MTAGYITDIDASTIAQVSWRLGAGRDKLDAAIDHTVGIRLLKHVGDRVEKGKSREFCQAFEPLFRKSTQQHKQSEVVYMEPNPFRVHGRCAIQTVMNAETTFLLVK